MLRTLIVIGVIYIGILFFLAIKTKTDDKTSKQYLLGGSNLGALLGFFTIAATLFSTFSLLGMPDFFRTHGIGAWIFLTVSHCIMAFGLIWMGYELRKKAHRSEWFGMAGFIRDNYQSKFAGLVLFLGVFIFLIPYISIQIRGVAIFLNATFPHVIPIWAWSTLLIVIMVAYSEIGGLKAIIYSDVIQGVLLLTAIWIIGVNCLNHFGGVVAMFEEVKQVNTALLSVPGPHGLFDWQFLIGSMIAIALMPYTQPQIATRLVIIKNVKSLHRLAVGLGLFGVIIILPTVFMGMYGAVLYPEATTAEFLNHTYVGDQTHLIASLVMIGIIAAAISTSDSQLFALGGELRSILTGEDRSMVKLARIGIVVFALVALIFSLMASDELALLARTSFTGTALLAPMIFTGVFYPQAYRLKAIPAITFLGMMLFVASLLDVIPHRILSIRMDLVLLLLIAGLTLILIAVDKLRQS